MITLCCTQKVRDRLGLPPKLPASLKPTNRLGNWYVNLVQFGQRQVVLATSERSLLTVVLPARALRKTIEPNLRHAVGQLLAALAIPSELTSLELAEMQNVNYTSATNRRVIGSMNEFAFQLGYYLDATVDTLALSLQLNETPMSAAGLKSHYGIPREVAHELLLSQGNQN